MAAQKQRRLNRKQLAVCDQTGDEAFRLPQCECGNDMTKYIEITDLHDVGRNPEDGPIVVDVICFECFARGVIDGNIAVK